MSAVGLGAFTAMRLTHGSPLRTAAVAGAIGGAGVLGYNAGKFIDTSQHGQWYDKANASARAAETKARDWFQDAGADASLNEPTDIKVSRTISNGSFTPGRFMIVPERIALGQSRFDAQGNVADDIVFHEYSHRVIDHYAPGMQRGGHPGGAIGEALADTFACVLDRDDWTLAEDAGTVIRALDDPTSVPGRGGPYPTHRDQIDESGFLGYGTTEIHMASTVAGHASYVIGDTLGRDKLGALYMDVLTSGALNKDSDFEDLAEAAEHSAGKLWGAGSNEQSVVRSAWQDAGYLDE
jgi:hypothetical protein